MPALSRFSGTRMRAVVHAPQMTGVDVAVDLRRRERAVAEQLLDRAEVRAAVEQVRRERVTQPMWVGDDPAQCARVEALAPRGEEEGVVRTARESRPRLAQVAAEPERRLLAERHDPLLPALAAADEHELLLEVDVPEVETDGLGAAEACRVDKLDEGPVPQRDRVLALERLERVLDLRGGG